MSRRDYYASRSCPNPHLGVNINIYPNPRRRSRLTENDYYRASASASYNAYAYEHERRRRHEEQLLRQEERARRDEIAYRLSERDSRVGRSGSSINQQNLGYGDGWPGRDIYSGRRDDGSERQMMERRIYERRMGGEGGMWGASPRMDPRILQRGVIFYDDGYRRGGGRDAWARAARAERRGG
ncbi:MAG: hypothetical protein Q9209_005278 [Squamulea sp. 1 TL-2023]